MLTSECYRYVMCGYVMYVALCINDNIHECCCERECHYMKQFMCMLCLQELQTDYQRFMDYTDGKYGSDYMMLLRRHGMKLSEKRLSDVSEYQEQEIRDILLPRLSRRGNI